MGMFFSKAWGSLFKSDPISIVMVGLDAAGKTTILYKLKLGEVVSTIPTIEYLRDEPVHFYHRFVVGFNVETVRYKNLNFTVWDVGGQTVIRPLWKHYYTSAKGVIYVVDTNDISRIDEARDELNEVLSADELRDASLLVFANKQDLPNSAPCAEIAKRLGLPDMRNRSWHIQASSAPSGDGLYEGLDWLARDLATRKQGSF